MSKNLARANEWLRQLVEGELGHELENITLANLETLKAHEGYILCSYIIPVKLADKDGNWEVGSIASIIDTVGGVAIYSFSGHIKASVDFSISFYSTTKVQEEVEIEAKVAGERGTLTSVLVEVRKKDNGQLIALGKQWMTSNNPGFRKVSKL
ncbi:uncharacterized protein LOC123215653 [Mangifera indica]|uniref:uncharacterized protein LOC123215653 n=1 Tax=Mangifera indica TaxID=29780 RepID=UPI001CFAF612|nr:uncharacterized protein LOC123215653 [Mangifera indica]